MRYSYNNRVFRTNILVILIVAALCLSFFGILLATPTEAQTKGPYVVLSWTTNTYAPQGYMGRILPIANSSVNVTLDVIDDGKPVNLSPYEIRWYLGDEPFKKGDGLDRISVGMPDVFGEGTYTIRAEVKNYKKGTLVKYLQIPVVRPKAVIQAPLPGGRVTGRSVELRAIPYFFNITRLSELVFDWLINNEVPEIGEKEYNNPDLLKVTINEDAAPGAAFSVGLSVNNPQYTFEKASQETSLTYTP